MISIATQIYSAGLMSQSFWFVETKQVIKLVSMEKSSEEIKKICLEENLFGGINEYREKRIYGYIWNRVANLDNTLISLFLESDLQTQKLIVLFSILKNDRLFFEFLFEVYREKIMLGIPTLEVSDVKIFFNRKETQNGNIAKWIDTTKRKLGSCYLNFMEDSNLLTSINKERKITPPILDIAFERYLNANGYSNIVKAITGVN